MYVEEIRPGDLTEKSTLTASQVHTSTHDIHTHAQVYVTVALLK